MLEDKINSKEATISVIGLGYVGLPLALAFAKAGFNVVGFDIDEDKVKQLNECNDITGETENQEIKKVIESRLFITSSPEKISADFIIICVPTPINSENKPELGPIESASALVGKSIKKDSIVILESTVYPGVTEEVIKPIIESESGLVCGTDFSLAYSPERINPGDKHHTLGNTVKIVGGYDSETTEVTAILYGTIVNAGIHKVSNIKTAEAVKIVENVQRAVNISLVDEFAIMFEKMGISTFEVIDAARTKWNFHPYFPNAGVGGHCISVDPYYLIHKSRESGYEPKIISSSMETIEFMPKHVTNIIMNYLAEKENKKILLLGLTYKENISDTRNTPAEKIAKEFAKNNIKVLGYDPLLDRGTIEKMGIEPLESLDNIKNVDCFLFLIAHEKLKTITNEDFKRMSSKNALLFDVRGLLNKEHIESLGMKYKSL